MASGRWPVTGHWPPATALIPSAARCSAKRSTPPPIRTIRSASSRFPSPKPTSLSTGCATDGCRAPPSGRWKAPDRRARATLAVAAPVGRQRREAVPLAGDGGEPLRSRAGVPADDLARARREHRAAGGRGDEALQQPFGHGIVVQPAEVILEPARRLDVAAGRRAGELGREELAGVTQLLERDAEPVTPLVRLPRQPAPALQDATVAFVEQGTREALQGAIERGAALAAAPACGFDPAAEREEERGVARRAQRLCPFAGAAARRPGGLGQRLQGRIARAGGAARGFRR